MLESSKVVKFSKYPRQRLTRGRSNQLLSHIGSIPFIRSLPWIELKMDPDIPWNLPSIKVPSEHRKMYGLDMDWSLPRKKMSNINRSILWPTHWLMLCSPLNFWKRLFYREKFSDLTLTELDGMADKRLRGRVRRSDRQTLRLPTSQTLRFQHPLPLSWASQPVWTRNL